MQNSDVAITLLFYFLIGLIGAIYSLLGQGGGSGYLAVMSYFDFPPAYMKPAALTMNIFVTTGVVLQLTRRGGVNWGLCMPFLVLSVPAAFAGGAMTLTDDSYEFMVGVLLLLAAIKLFTGGIHEHEIKQPAFLGCVLAGGAAGYLGGLSGIGGGILLSPFLIFMRWCTLRDNIALSAVFVLANSVAALCGLLLTPQRWPTDIVWMVPAALAGSILGALIPDCYVRPRMLHLLLSAVLTVAALKLIFA